MMSYRLNPGPQVRRALVETRVLNEVFLTFVAHHAAVIPVEVVQVWIILMSFFCGVRCAAGVIFPRRTLRDRNMTTFRKWTSEFVSSSGLYKCVSASVSQQWMLCSEWVPSEWESDKNITIIHTTPVHQLTSGEDKRWNKSTSSLEEALLWTLWYFS